MPAMSAWKHLTSAGVIADTPASAWQYRYSIHEEVTPRGWGLGYQTLTGSWVMQVLDGGSLLFEQTVSIQVVAVTLNLGGVAFYACFPTNNAGGNVAITVPSGGVATLGDPAGNLYLEPETSEWGQGSFHLYATWESPIYQMALPAGARVHVVFHNVGWPTIWPVFAPFETRVQAPAGIAALIDEPGIHRIFSPGEGARLTQRASTDQGTTYWRRQTGLVMGSSAVAKGPDNTLVVLGPVGAADWHLRLSLDDGLTFEEGLFTVWPSGVADVDLVVAADGAILTIARVGDTLYCRTSRDNFTTAAKVGPATRPFRLAEHQGRMVATDGTTVYESWDGGRSWAAKTGALS